MNLPRFQFGGGGGMRFGDTRMSSLEPQALSGFTSAYDPLADPNSYQMNLARGHEVIKGRRDELAQSRRQGGAQGQWMAGGDAIAQARSDFSPFADFFAALIGKEATGARVNVGSMGRLKSQDVATGNIYDTQSGELAPGQRGKGGWWTPEEFSQIGEAGLEGLRRAQRQAVRRR